MVLMYFLGTLDEYSNRDNLLLAMSIQGNYKSVLYFSNREEADSWVQDCMMYRRLEAAVNLYAGTPRHRIGFMEIMMPAYINLVGEWGVDKVPPDIRFAIRDSYEYFHLGAPIFPQDIMVEVERVSSDSNEVTVEMV